MGRKLTTIFALACVIALAIVPGALGKKDSFKASLTSAEFAATYTVSLDGKDICVKAKVTRNELGEGAFQPEDLQISAKGADFFADPVSSKRRCSKGGAVGKALRKKGKAAITVLDGYQTEIAKGKLK